MRRLSKKGSGAVSKPQLYFLLFMGIPSADGMRTKTLASLPPYSTSSTSQLGSSLRREATMAPAEPAPTTM